MDHSAAPLVTIVIRTCDRPLQLQRAVRSALAQTYRPLEVVVVNDGGGPVSDSLWRLSDVTASLRCVSPLPPGGRARAANAGIAAAAGAYIGFLDDDDTLSADHLATLVPALQAASAQVAYSQCEIVEATHDADRDSWTETDRYILHGGEFDPHRLLLENYIPLMTALFTRKALEQVGGFDETLDLYEDWDLLIRLALHHPFVYIPRVTAQYYHWNPHRQATLRLRGTPAEREAYCAVVLKHWTRITPEVLHAYFTAAGQRLGGYLASERKLARALEDNARLRQVNRELEERAAHPPLDLESIRRKLACALEDNARLRQVNRELEERAAHLSLDLETIRQSVGWLLLQRGRALLARLLPLSSRRRNAYYLVHRLLSSYLREGGRATAQKLVSRARRALTRSPSPSQPGSAAVPGVPPALRRHSVDIVLPIFNAAHALRACLQSLRACTDPGTYRLLAVDDASTDPEVAALLDAEAAAGRLTLLRNSQNQGFVRSVNSALRITRGDVVILNSDTVLSPGWLAKLQRAAYSRPGVGTVTPFSNHASLCSIPEPMRYNHLPAGFTIETFAAFIDRIALRYYPEIPAGVGFCLYLRREVLDAVGLLDETQFERGYGEDTDFCLRARAAGFINVLDDATFVYHQGGQSFESDTDPAALAEKNQMIQRNLLRLHRRYPRYRDEVARCLQETLSPLHEYLRLRLRLSRPGTRAAALRPSPEA